MWYSCIHWIGQIQPLHNYHAAYPFRAACSANKSTYQLNFVPIRKKKHHRQKNVCMIHSQCAPQKENRVKEALSLSFRLSEPLASCVYVCVCVLPVVLCSLLCKEIWFLEDMGHGAVFACMWEVYEYAMRRRLIPVVNKIRSNQLLYGQLCFFLGWPSSDCSFLLQRQRMHIIIENIGDGRWILTDALTDWFQYF